jgi:DNA polymerase-3 subunit delta'
MSWDHIRGHDEVRRQFEAADRRGRLGQAYLFAGPPGVGKKLFANELAKAVLCESPPEALVACDRCPSCTLIAAGTHPDAFVARKPDDKHELPVAVVLDFIAQLGLKPTRGTRKVGLLDDTDDFNEESANCFLKTLEEPPPGSLLILLATAAENQLPTILSRCQVVRFRPLPPLVLRDILAEHGVTDPERADRLIRLAEGSAGQALALNDDALWSFRGTLVESIAAARPDPVALAGAWAAFVEDVGKESAAQRRRASLVVRLLLDALGLSLRLSLGADAGSNPTDAAKLRVLADRFGPDGLVDLMEKCVEADYHIDRRVQLVLVIESLADSLTRSAAAPV